MFGNVPAFSPALVVGMAITFVLKDVSMRLFEGLPRTSDTDTPSSYLSSRSSFNPRIPYQMIMQYPQLNSRYLLQISKGVAIISTETQTLSNMLHAKVNDNPSNLT